MASKTEVSVCKFWFDDENVDSKYEFIKVYIDSFSNASSEIPFKQNAAHNVTHNAQPTQHEINYISIQKLLTVQEK